MASVRLAIDAESGDFGPRVILTGVLAALKESHIPFSVSLCGDRDKLTMLLKELDGAAQELRCLTIEHCAERISQSDTRARVWKTRMNSSIIRCITLQKEGKVDASVSAGDTAILMGAALFILGRAEGVLRPALAAFLPTIRKKPVLLLDVGANLECRAEHLISFGTLGLEYVKRFLKVADPHLTLLNIGKELNKGTRAICEAGKVFQRDFSTYQGFIEGHQVLRGESDVVVCDGFTGNVLLKASESFYPLAASMFESDSEMLQSLKVKMAALNPEKYGAVPFLGIKGTVLKAHGGSSAQAIANAIMTSVAAVKSGELKN